MGYYGDKCVKQFRMIRFIFIKSAFHSWNVISQANTQNRLV